MGIKKAKPTSPARRFATWNIGASDKNARPPRSLRDILPNNAGRNNQGKITARHRGGRNKRFYRIVDFKRDKNNIPAVVESIQRDPNRTAELALVSYSDGEKRFILHPLGLKIGDTILSGESVEVSPGNCMLLKNIPLGIYVHNMELRPGQGGKMARSAGSAAQVLARERGWVHLRMPSGEIRLIPSDCRATIGELGNTDVKNVVLGSAGRSRHLGIRPKVRGVAMNAVDHPHGGGKGKGKGHNIPRSETGVLAKGFKTRKRKSSDSLIVHRRSR